MNAGGSPAAVAHSSCLSSSICSAAARQASASNVGLPYTPGGCVLSLSSAVVTPSFFRIPRRHKNYSTDSVFVVKGSSSAFEVDKDREEHGLQTAEKHVRKGKVSWSYDGKPTILWGSQDEQDKASLSQAKRQSSAAKEDMKADKLASKFGLQHEPFKPFVGEHHNNSIALQSQESAFHSIKERPSSPNRQESELFNPLSASRLLVGLPGFKQAAERDTLAAHNAYSQFQGAARFHEAPVHGEATPKGGPGLTSKLEEILNNFRSTQKREEVLKDPRSRQKRPDDPFEEGAAARSDLLNAASKVFRKGSNLNGTHTWKSLRNHIQRSNNGGFVHKTSAEDVDVKQDSIASTEGHRIVHHGERNFTRGQKNTRGSSGDNEPLDSINRSPATPWGVEKGRFSVSQMHGLAKDGSSTFVKRRAAKSESLQYNSRNSSFKSKAGGRSTENKKSFSRENYYERSHTSRMNQSLYVPKSEAHKLDVSAEDSVDTTSAITSDSEADRSENPGEQQQASSAGLTKNRKASWHSHPIPSLPFEVQYSYSETPNAPVIRYRERPYSPFGPETMQRPWTGGPPLKKSKKNLPLFDSFNPPPKGKKGVKYVQDPGPYPKGKGPKPAKSREEILGEPLSTQEIAQLIDVCHNEDRQLNLGRDGLTHNMLDLVHCHWKRRRVIKVRCLGVPTIDMDNVCFHLEDKTGGKIVFRSGGVVYLFRGRNYNYRDRPQIPLMLWKPPAPVYPKLIKRAPEGLTVEEADRLRLLGKKVEPLCTLSKNGVYINLVDDVRAAFKIDKLVRINCRGLNPSDYKKIGAKLKDLVPCVLLSFDDEQILMWKGKEIPSADVGSLKGFDAVEALTEGSSLSHVASTSMNMEQLKAGVFANVSTAENNASLSGNVEVQLSSSSLEGFNDHASAPGSADGESDNAMVSIDGSQISSWSLDNGHTSHVTGDTPQISHSELSLENLMLTNLKASNEVDTPLHLASASQDERNLMFQNTRLQEENDTTLNEEKELSDAACIRKVEYKDYSLFTEVQEIDMTILQAASALESRSTSLANGNNVGVAEEGLIDSCVFVRVDDLWDQAITSGIAIQLDNVEMDIDIVARKAIELAEEAPAGEDYTRKLMRDLSPKTHKTYRPEHELQKHLKKIRKMRLEKKLSKRPFRKRTEDVPYVLPQDGLPNSGMPVDELARLLSIK